MPEALHLVSRIAVFTSTFAGNPFEERLPFVSGSTHDDPALPGVFRAAVE